MSEQQVKCSHCQSTELEECQQGDEWVFRCKKCEKYTRVGENVAESIAKKVVICLGVSTVVGTIGFVVGGPPGAVAGAMIGSAITGGGDTIV